MCDLKIPDGSLDDWLGVLKSYQRNIISAFLKDGGPEGAAERWLGATGSPNIVPFGGAADTRPFWVLFKKEIRKYLCDEGAYAEDKLALSKEGAPTKAMIVSAISAAIGASIGFSATVLAPAVTIILFTVGKMGIRAYCEMKEV